MKAKPYEKWYAAFRQIVMDSKHGIKKRLSEETGKTAKYIGDIFNGRRNASQNLQDSLSLALGHTYEEMLAIGADILGETKEPFPNYEKIMRLPKLERAWAILREAFTFHGLENYRSAVQSSKNPKFARKFLADEQTEEELWEDCLISAERIKAKVEAAFRGEIQ